MNARYLIDTTVFMKFQHGHEYDKSCFPTHFKNFLKLLDNGIAVSIDKVKEELSDDFFCEEYDNIFKDSIDNEISSTYNDLRKKFPKYFEQYTLDNPDDADIYLVTYAYHNNLCIVTQDEFQSIRRDYNIPALCDLLEGVCIDNKENKENAGMFDGGFGCICLTELIRVENLMR